MTADRNEMSRRSFTATTSLAAAAVVAGQAQRALGANDRVVLASIGIRGQGDALKQGFARLPGVTIKTLCDIDENLFAKRANDPELKDVATFKPGYQKDLRRVFDDKDIDGVMIATPNHWHALRRSGRCRPVSTSTSRSPRPTPCGRGARWSRPRASTAGSARSAR